MKRILSLILVMIATTLPMIAQESSNSSSTTRVELEVHRTNNSSHPVHRAPMFIKIDTYYNEQSGVLDICYDGEASGEIYLYLNDAIIGYDSQINTSFQISSLGQYKIEIVGDSWIAIGYVKL